MKKTNLNRYFYLLLTLIYFSPSGYAQMIMMSDIIPDNTATHTSMKTGDWNDPNTWNTGSVPGLASIVVIRMGDTINYNVNSNAHIFAIRNEGTMVFRAPGGATRKLVVDTFFCGMMSNLDIKANRPTDGTIDIHFKAFDIEKKKRGEIGGNGWNAQARSHYSDEKRMNDHFGNRLFSDGPGVLGRYEWDPTQATLGLMTMNEVTILGQEKTPFLRTTGPTPRRRNKTTLEGTPTNWNIGDDVVLSGTQGIFRVRNDGIRTQDEEFIIEAINEGTNEVTFNTQTRNSHQGIPEKNLFCHLSNLTRNITFKSIDFTDDNNNVNDDITRRGHTMFMRTTDVKIHFAAFKDLGRSNKHNILDDFKYRLRRTGRVDEDGKPFVQIRNFVEEKADSTDIENQRGRYSMHFHRMKDSQTKMAEAHGLAVWGSPGWGMVHHDSHASFANNVVYFVDGSGMVAESGSETGIWENNLVTTARPDGRNYYFADMDRDAPSALNSIVSDLLDDDFRIGEAYGLQGRAVRMINNVAASSREAYAYDGGGTVLSLRDKVRTNVYPEDIFPLQEYIDPAAAPLLEFNNNEAYGCSSGFRSKDRAAQAFHHNLSIIDNHTTWNTGRAMYITTNFGYMVRNANYYNGDSAGLVGGDMDNLCLVNTTFHNWRGDGFTDGRGTNFNPDHKLNFVNVRIPGFNRNRIYGQLDRSNENVFNTSVLEASVDVTFSRDSDMDTRIDVNTNDYTVIVSGMITDRLGTYPFGHGYTDRFPTIRNRTYDFTNKETLEDYVRQYGIAEDSRGTYTTITEFISDRATGETFGIDIRINIIGLNAEDYRTGDEPELTVLQPTEATTLFAGDDMIVRAEANDPDGIKEVRLYVNGELIRIDTEAPYSWGGNSSLQNVTEGRYRIKVVAIDNTGQRTKKIIVLNVLPTALRDAGFDKDNTGAIMVTPNPATGSNITIYQKGNLYLRLYDITGKKIMKLDVNSNELNLDVSDLSSGLYIIKSDKISRKFIVK
ncbi:T9SS C-terminal target domain-containing protein [Aquimarina sp. AD1]|uniref:T9SS type A sorting domain-containing protein n=1 Tax=Aquimarina sp. (strain AD1) TaxID=1714848 RepID=UPI000E50C081|nr:Ig-like domain-containing protein [Aquimarina sp. AD1]AXT54870.1 T9SS C-terminal target domain-containing protein [Aquimarina sp. AD1]RKN13715.1 T9SS C-terminal target domain-containing protein [Aquimarina sp. AD1]